MENSISKYYNLRSFIIVTFAFLIIILLSFVPSTNVNKVSNNLNEFNYEPSGNLLDGSGTGIPDNNIYNIEMRFPVQNAPAYCNSQVYSFGGKYGPASSQGWKDSRNFSYPWRDNFCEKRSNKNLKCCPNKIGHQGQDIRPASSEDKKHLAVAPEDVIITHIGRYSVSLKSLDGRIFYKYLHLDKKSLLIKKYQTIKKGEPIGYISNQFKKGVSTTVHLHFEMRVSMRIGNNSPGYKLVSPYSTLVNSYKKLIEDSEKQAL